MRICIHFAFSFIFLVSLGLAQPTRESQVPATKLGAFLDRTGVVLVKEFTDAGTLNGDYETSIQLKVVTAYERGKESERMRGVRILIEQKNYSRSNSSYLDMEELDAFVNAVGSMTEASKAWKKTPAEHNEVMFSSKGEFTMGLYQEGTGQTFFASSGIVQNAQCYFSVDKLPQLLQIAEKARVLLMGKE